MSSAGINSVVLVGNLTRDPELRSTASGMSVCSMRIAVNDRRKDNSTGEWVDKPGYYSITVFGNQGENCAQYLSKGRPCGVKGRLAWHEWDDKETGKHREAVEVIAETVQFLGGREDGASSEPQIPVDDEFAPAPVAAGADDEIPF